MRKLFRVLGPVLKVEQEKKWKPWTVLPVFFFWSAALGKTKIGLDESVLDWVARDPDKTSETGFHGRMCVMFFFPFSRSIPLCIETGPSFA